MNDRIVLAFSGGPASTAAIPWLLERHGVEVVAVTLDLGQGRELDGIRERALAAGAVRCHVLDTVEAFARNIVWAAARAGADAALPPSVLAAPIVAQSLAQMARIEGAGAVAHGACGPAGARIARGVATLDPTLDVLSAPSRAHVDLDDLAADPCARGLVMPVEGPLRVATSIAGRSITGPALADAWQDVPAEAASLTRAPRVCPDEPALLEIAFDQGLPVGVNGVSMPLVEIFDSVATIAGDHGVGRVDYARLVGADRTEREVREAPALAVLRQAHQALESFTMPPGGGEFRAVVGAQYTSILLDGRWFSPLRQDLDAYKDAVQARVSGIVRLRLFRGESRIVGRRLVRYDQPSPAGELATSAH